MSSDDDAKGTPREPLLPKEETNNLDSAETSNNGAAVTNRDAQDGSDSPPQISNEVSSSPLNPPSAAVLGLCTLAIVLVGLGLLALVSFLPLCLYWALARATQTPHGLLAAVAILLNLLHLRALWISAGYLRVLRTLALPFRRLLLPLVPFVARIEAIREGETVQYYPVPSSTPRPEFRKSVRRHYRRMQNIYQRHAIRHRAVNAETDLVLRDVLPIVWQHQQRSTGKAFPLEDFVKRALVVTVVPDGVLDLYYDNNQRLVGVQFSIWQGNVWHWFMYFCAAEASQTGIWWHGALLAIQRGHVLSPGVKWVNSQMHQKESKLHAGYTAADPRTQLSILAQISPWRFTSPIPMEAQEIRLWDTTNEDE